MHPHPPHDGNFAAMSEDDGQPIRRCRVRHSGATRGEVADQDLPLRTLGTDRSARHKSRSFLEEK
jgi:hypothetical protein